MSLMIPGKGHMDKGKKKHIKKKRKKTNMIEMLKCIEMIFVYTFQDKQQCKGYLQLCLKLEKGGREGHYPVL